MEVLGSSSQNILESPENIIVEISGEAMSSGVYNLPGDSRVNDLLIVSGGLTASVDRNWTDKYLNRAAKLIDGQKAFVPWVDQQLGGGTANQTGGIKLYHHQINPIVLVP